MGLFELIGSSGSKMKWAHPSKSTVHPEEIMGLFELIGSSGSKSQWAYPSASVVPYEEIMGPFEKIGSSSSKCNRPIRGHQQHFTKNNWPVRANRQQQQ